MTIKIDTKMIKYGALGLGIMLVGGVIYYFKKSSNTDNPDNRSNSVDSSNSNDFKTLISMGYTEEEANKKLNRYDSDNSDESWNGGSKRTKNNKKRTKNNKKRTKKNKKEQKRTKMTKK